MKEAPAARYGQQGLSKEGEFEGPKQIRRILSNALGSARALALARHLANARERLILDTPIQSLGTSHTQEDLRVICLLADKVILGLRSHYQNLRDGMPKEKPSGLVVEHRLRMAQAFRQGQLDILASNMSVLEEFLDLERSEGHLLSLERLLGLTAPAVLRNPLHVLLESACGVEANPGEVWENGLHELTFTVWTCLAWLLKSSSITSPTAVVYYAGLLEQAYGEPGSSSLSSPSQELSEDEELVAIVSSYKNAVEYAAESTAHQSIFAEPAWTVDFLVWGLSVFRQESVVLESRHNLVETTNGKQYEELLFWLPTDYVTRLHHVD